MLEIGSLVDGKYKILNKVGQGGMSVVYLAMNEKANKQWAVKEVRKDGIKDFEVVKQGLVAETDILKRLSHPNLPSIIDVIDTDDSFIIIMDYIQGNSLNKALHEFGAQPQENVIEWAKQLCDVLGYLHTRTPAIIYRDMKPANIMLKPDGNVTLIDFGTAREFKEKNLADTTCLGTVGYAAPEQFGGMGQTDARTDIYCLGATLYHLVTGMNPCEPPYEIKPIREINPALSSGLERIILKCTQRDPNDRYQSAAELMYALEHYEEIDDLYRKKQKKKLNLFLTTSILTVVCAATSVWGYVSAENKKSSEYEVQIARADGEENATEKTRKYFQAMITDPVRTEAYEKLNEYLASDFVLTGEELKLLNSLMGEINLKDGEIVFAGEETEDEGGGSTVNVLAQLKESSPKAYANVCYDFGWNILSNYETADVDRYTRATLWFKMVLDADASGENASVAKTFCEIRDCLYTNDQLKGNEKVQQTEKKAENRKKLWQQIQVLIEHSKDYSVDYKVQVLKEATVLLHDTIGDLQLVVGKEEILNVLESIQKEAETVEINIDTKKPIADLKEKVQQAKTRATSIKAE